MSDINKFTTKEVLNKVLLDSSGNAVNAFSHTTQEALNAALDDDNSRLNVNLVGGTIGGDVTINGDLTVNGDGVGAYDEIISGGLVINVTDGQNVKGLHITQLDAGEWTSMMEAVAYGLLIRSTANDTTPAFKVQGNGTSNEVLSALSNGNVGIGTASPDHNLDIVSSGNAEFELTRTSGASIFMQSQSAKGLIGTSSNHSLNFLTNGGTRLTIDTSGNLTVSSGSAIQFGDSSYKIIGSTVGNYLRFFTESTQALQIDDSQNATFSGNVKITKAESSASEFISALEINRDYGSATATDLLTGMIFTDDNSVQAGIFTNRYNSAGSYNSRLQFYVNNSSSSMTPQTALGDPALIIDESKNATFAGRVAISSAFTASELLGVKGSVGSDWGARIENTSSTGAGALIKSATTNAGVQLFQVRSGSDNVFTIMGDQNATFAGNVTVNGSTTTPMTISADTDKVFTLSSGIGETDNVPTIQTINTAGSALVGFGVRASVINLVTGSAKRLVLDDNSRISLSNNDSGGTGGSDSTSGNTLLGWKAGNDIVSGGLNNTSIGHASGFKLTTGDANTYLGRYAGLGNLTGSSNTFIGSQSGLSDNGSSHSNNTGVGANSLLSITTGGNNTAIGYNSLDAGTDAHDNTAIGFASLGSAVSVGYAVAIGNEAMNNGNVTSDADGAVGIGYKALYALTSGAGNTSIGYQSSEDVNTGAYNTVMGYQAFSADTDGSANVVIGWKAGRNIHGSTQNVMIGYKAMANMDNNPGDNIANCVAIGYEAFLGSDNDSTGTTTATNGTVAIGHSSLKALTTGATNTAVGYQAGSQITIGSSNVALGHQAMDEIISGDRNIAIGHNAIGNAQGGATSGDSKDNIAIGYQSQGGQWANAQCLKNVSIGNYSLDGALDGALQNTAIGYASLGAVTEGDNNVAVGIYSGDNITTGTKNVTIGQQARTSAVGGTNEIVIGATATGAGDNSVVLGNSDVTAVLCASDGEAQVYASAIRFPATQVGNSNDNALDDYEEGLYTPSITGSSSGNFVLNTSFDRTSYTKIGRQVTYTGEIRIASDNSTSGEIRFSLPFDSADLTDTAGKSVSTSVYLSGHGDANIDSNKLLIYIEENSSFFRIAHVADDDTFAYLTHANVDGAWNLAFTLTYFTS